MDHEEIRASLGAYVLGAMPPDEIAQMRTHILSCETCMREADELADAAGSFGLSAGTSPLPAGFSDRVLQSVREERPDVIPQPARRRVSRWAVLAGAAAAAITIGAVSMVASTRSDLARNQRILTEVLHQDGLELRGTSGAVGEIVSSGDGTTFVATGLQEAPSGHDYQLWFIKDGKPQSVGIFDAADGIAIVETELSIVDYEAAAVTIEPDGGLDQPSGDAVLTSS